MQFKFLAGGSIVMLAVGLGGCGDNNGGGGGAIVQPVQGRVTQGPVKQATIFADRLDLGARSVKDTDEVSTVTNDSGNFTLNVPAGYGAYVLVSQGGTDTVTNKPAMQMIAPAGAANVTPLTTLVALAPASEQQALKDKIAATGVSFDADISTSATPAALLLVKSVETAVEALGKAIDPDGTKIPANKLNEIQEATLAALADQFASTATAFTDVTALKADISAAVTNAVVAIETAQTNIVVSNDATVASAVAATVDTVASHIIASAGSLSTTTQATETAVFTPTVRDAIDGAVTTSTNTASTVVTVTTRTDNTNPAVVLSGSPALTGIAINAGIKVTFSEALNAATVNSTNFKVTGVSGTVSYDASTFTATFQPSADLAYSTTYTVTLGSGITDVAGNRLAPTTLTFKTIERPLTGSTGATGSNGTGANF